MRCRKSSQTLGGDPGDVCPTAVTPMVLKPSSAKVIDLSAAFDVGPEQSAEGPIVWATVRIVYSLQGLSPDIAIRVPVPWNAQDTQEQRYAQALRSARQLIEHACRAVGVAPAEAGSDLIEDVVEAITPAALEGVAQELGLASPSVKQKSRGR